MATVEVYPKRNETYDDAAGEPITSAGAIVDVSKYILDALRKGDLLDWDPLDVFQPDDRTGTGDGDDGAPVDAQYVVAVANPTLTSERVLTAGSNITLTPGAGTLTISATGGGGGNGLPPGWISVKDYGAVGDGETDDTEAIQLAIDTAAATVNSGTTGESGGETVDNVGATVFFPPGVYVVSTTPGRAWKIACKSYVNLVGVGYNSVLQSALGQYDAARTIGMSDSGPLYNVTIQGLRIYGRETEQPPVDNYQRAGIFMGNTVNFRVIDCFIHDVADCIRMYGPLCDRTVIRGNWIYGCPTDIGRECIQMEGARNSMIIDNFIYDCPWANGIKMEGAAPDILFNNVVSGNQVRNCNGGILVAGGCLVSDNIVENNKASGEGGCQVTGPNVRFVNNTILACHQYGISIFREASNVLISGNRISNITGTENIAIAIETRDDLAPVGVTIVDNDITGGADTKDGIRFVNCGDGMIVANNRIGGVANGITYQVSDSDGTDVRISGNSVSLSDNGGIGIALYCAAALSIERCQIIGNTVLPASGVTGTTGVRFGGLGTIDMVIVCHNDLTRCAADITYETSPPANSVIDGNMP